MLQVGSCLRHCPSGTGGSGHFCALAACECAVGKFLGGKFLGFLGRKFMGRKFMGLAPAATVQFLWRFWA
jgi:hypothetical protein